ncbi:MAG: hypothetical protein ACI9U2_004048 [Bradymonadia bacterium]|jgi:hypothetical protein
MRVTASFGLVPLLALLATLGLGGCAGMIHTEIISGACAEERDRCVADFCGMVKDTRDCENGCAFEGRMCARRQGQTTASTARMADEQALLVDFFGKKIAHSKGVVLEQSGAITKIPGAHALAPGAFIRMRLTLPPKLRQAELSLTHKPGGAPCYLTVTVGEKTILGRYSPPQTKVMKTEVFDFTAHIVQDAETPQTLEVLVFNNSAAGSTAPYHLASAQIFYRAMETPGLKPNVE